MLGGGVGVGQLKVFGENVMLTVLNPTNVAVPFENVLVPLSGSIGN